MKNYLFQKLFSVPFTKLKTKNIKINNNFEILICVSIVVFPLNFFCYFIFYLEILKHWIEQKKKEEGVQELTK